MFNGPSSGSPLRVAHLTPTFFGPESVVGGGERYVFNLAAALARADAAGAFRQAIFALGDTEDFFVQDGIPIRVLKNENPSPDRMSGVSAQLWREVGAYDVLHVHQCLATFGIYACVVGRALGRRMVATDLGGGDSEIMRRGRGLALADGVVSISRYAHSLLGSNVAGPHDVLIGPVDTETYRPPDQPYDGPPRVLCVSRILPHKGIDRVIRALPAGLELRVVGQAYDAGYHAHLQELARDKQVIFIHDADDARLRTLYHEATVFAQASTALDYLGREVRRPELMGLAPLEAMASGLPVIVSGVASLPELADDAAFFRVFTGEAALAAALRDVLEGRWPPPDAGVRARRHVVAHYGYEPVGTRLAAFYRRVMATEPAG